MAQKVAVTYTDDIDGSKAAETVSFALDGANYQIDLSARNAKALRKALAEFQAAARRVGSAGQRSRVDPPARSRRTRRAAAASEAAPSEPDAADSGAGAGETNSSDIRAWAVANGLTVSARGRISDQVRQQYADAHA